MDDMKRESGLTESEQCRHGLNPAWYALCLQLKGAEWAISDDVTDLEFSRHMLKARQRVNRRARGGGLCE